MTQITALFCRFQYRTRQVTQRGRASELLHPCHQGRLRAALHINSHRGRNQYLKRALAGDAFFRWPLNAAHPQRINSINEEKGDALARRRRSRAGEERTLRVRPKSNAAI